MINKLKNFITLIFHGHYDTSTPEGRSNERARNIALSAATAMFAKVVAMIVPLVTVRLTLSYMGEEIYGLWSAIVSFFAAFSFADLGLGSGLQTELSRATALDDKSVSKKIVSSTYIMLIFVATVILCVFAASYRFVDWASIINAESEVAIKLAGQVVCAIVIAKLINIPLALIQRTQTAMQESYKSNLWQCGGNILSLVLVVLAYYLDLGVMVMIWMSSTVTIVVAAINMFVYFTFQHPEIRPSMKYFDIKVCKRMLVTGVQFFALSIFMSLSLSLDSFIVAHTCSLAEVTPYTVMYKVAHLISVVCIMLSAPLWGANGEAMQRGEYDWVSRSTKKVAIISLALSTIASIGVVLTISPALWILTDGVVQPDYPLLVLMCLLQIVTSIAAPYFMVLNAAGIVKFQIVTYIIYAVVSLPMKFVFGKMYGMTAITAIGLVSYVLFLTIPTMWRGLAYLKKHQKSIKSQNE